MKHYRIFLVFLFGFSSLVHADERLTIQERTAFSLLGSIMDIVSAKIDNSSCYELAGQYSITLFATGMGGQRRQNNMVTVLLPDHETSLFGYPKSEIPEIGSRILTGYRYTSIKNDFDPVDRYTATYSFDSTGEMVEMTANLKLKNRFFEIQSYQTNAITSFTPGSSSKDEYETNLGWGMSRLSDPEYAKSIYWQRLKTSRDDGTDARTFFIRDLLAHGQACRIKIDISGHNNPDYISQEGDLTIEMASPTDPIDVFFN